MTTIKNAALRLLAAGGALLLPLTSAHADEATCVGPWKQVGQWGGPEWGEESPCDCTLNGVHVRGGVLSSSSSFAWLWSEGRGKVTLALELHHLSYYRYPAQLANGQPYSAQNGAGLDQQWFVDESQWESAWTGRYRSECSIKF